MRLYPNRIKGPVKMAKIGRDRDMEIETVKDLTENPGRVACSRETTKRNQEAPCSAAEAEMKWLHSIETSQATTGPESRNKKNLKWKKALKKSLKKPQCLLRNIKKPDNTSFSRSFSHWLKRRLELKTEPRLNFSSISFKSSLRPTKLKLINSLLSRSKVY